MPALGKKALVPEKPEESGSDERDLQRNPLPQQGKTVSRFYWKLVPVQLNAAITVS